MYSNILIPVALDHETLIAPKIRHAQQMLEPGGTITLLTVLEQVSGFVAEFVTVKVENHISVEVRKRLDAVATQYEGIVCDVITGKPGVEITRYARDKSVDLIVIGSHAPGATDYVLGSTTARVSRKASCSVLIVR